MKKIVALLLTIAISQNSFGQVSVTEDNDIKNFRFGLQVGTSFDWLNIDKENKFEKGGIGTGFDWGLQMEFKLNKTISVLTGVSLKSNTFKLKYASASSFDTTYYVLNKDDEFIDVKPTNFDTTVLSNTTNSTYWLKDRKIKANYVNIPIALKMKTNEIGYLTYYGQFGANFGFKTKARAFDQVAIMDSIGDPTPTQATKEKIDLNSGVSPIRVGLLIGAGAEYNFSGSTSAFLTIQYNHYFTGALRTDNFEDYLFKYDNTGTTISDTYKPVAAKVLPGSISITLGILF